MFDDDEDSYGAELILQLSGDDVEDILVALEIYEDHLMFHEDDSLYVSDVLNNIGSLRNRILRAHRERMH